MLERIAAANSVPDGPPPSPEAMMAMAKAHLERQRQTAFGVAA
jgi:hypothetical protein